MFYFAKRTLSENFIKVHFLTKFDQMLRHYLKKTGIFCFVLLLMYFIPKMLYIFTAQSLIVSLICLLLRFSECIVIVHKSNSCSNAYKLSFRCFLISSLFYVLNNCNICNELISSD